jgi:hypothetical protein
MFFQLRKMNNDSGIVLILVIVILLVMAISSASIFSQTMNQGAVSRGQIDDLVAQQLAKGIFWSVYNPKDPNATPNNPQQTTYVINGRTFTTGPATLPSGNLSISVTY